MGMGYDAFLPSFLPFVWFGEKRCGWGNWHKVRACILASPRFTFDYYLRSLSETALGKHCEQLMKSSEKYLQVTEADSGRKYCGSDVCRPIFADLSSAHHKKVVWC